MTTFDEQYELARRIGDKRFGTECEHESAANGRCTNCLRAVVTGFASGHITRHGYRTGGRGEWGKENYAAHH